jgi:uncharacterized protein
MVLQQNLKIDQQAIVDFCRRHHIRRLSLFGSVLTDRFRPDSDVDVLVEFEPGKTPGLFGIIDMEGELGTMLRAKVDFRTPEDISRHIRQRVLDSAHLIYAN